MLASEGASAGVEAPEPKRRRRHQEPPPSSSSCLLLESGPELLRCVCSFVSLQDGMGLRRVGRQLYNDADVFQYARILKYNEIDRLKIIAHGSKTEYIQKQDRIVSNLVNMVSLRAILRNETLPHHGVDLLHNMITYSNTDNRDAVAVLLEDGRPVVNVEMLEDAIKKGRTAMADAMQYDDRVQEGIQYCFACHQNPGAFECQRRKDCPEYVDSNTPRKYCFECVRTDGRACAGCEHLCQTCLDGENYFGCEDCNLIACCRDSLYCDSSDRLYSCVDCNRAKCEHCIDFDGVGWDLDGDIRCPPCARSFFEALEEDGSDDGGDY